MRYSLNVPKLQWMKENEMEWEIERIVGGNSSSWTLTLSKPYLKYFSRIYLLSIYLPSSLSIRMLLLDTLIPWFFLLLFHHQYICIHKSYFSDVCVLRSLHMFSFHYIAIFQLLSYWNADEFYLVYSFLYHLHILTCRYPYFKIYRNIISRSISQASSLFSLNTITIRFLKIPDLPSGWNL